MEEEEDEEEVDEEEETPERKTDRQTDRDMLSHCPPGLRWWILTSPL